MLAKKINHKVFTGFAAIFFIPLLFSCRKLVEPDPPAQSQSRVVTFSDAELVTAVLYGMYDAMKGLMAGRSDTYDVPKLTAFYSDEFTVINSSTYNQEVYLNAVSPEHSGTLNIWNRAYHVAYRANDLMEGIGQHGKNLPDSIKRHFTGEAKFARAWAHLALVNVFGDVPLQLTTDYEVNRLLARSKQAAVYKQIVSDLLSAKELVPDYYVDKNNQPALPTERVRANKDVVTAYLARVYLYMGEWQKAEAMASEVLAKTGTYSLNANLTAVFDNNSRENILQVFEAQIFAAQDYDLTIQDPGSASLPGYLSDSVLNKYETGDKRRTEWIGSRTSGTNTWHFPKKYKNLPTSGVGGQEYVPIMRLAEQYLIRAEAHIQQNKISESIQDLNQLRTRARAAATTAVPNPLPPLSLTLSKTDAMLALENEWTREMFMEGHRWFNLKRWKGINNPSISRADELMPSITVDKGASWQPYKMLLPIPFFDFEKNPKLVQNPGY